jgi:GntR family transcriptional regulator
VLFDIDQNSDVPIFEQIINQVIFGVAAGDLEVGALIPSVRELAPHLLVHPNTVAKAYDKLSDQGVLTARRGKGMEVTPEAPGLCRARRQEIIRARIRAALREATASALPAEDIRRLVEEELTRVNGKGR